MEGQDDYAIVAEQTTHGERYYGSSFVLGVPRKVGVVDYLFILVTISSAYYSDIGAPNVDI
jgi:hypothetical protein